MNKFISLFMILILSLCLFTACNDDDGIIKVDPIESSESESSAESSDTTSLTENCNTEEIGDSTDETTNDADGGDSNGNDTTEPIFTKPY